jgi:hypothetical protein
MFSYQWVDALPADSSSVLATQRQSKGFADRVNKVPDERLLSAENNGRSGIDGGDEFR